MKQNKRGVLMLTAMILSVSLMMCGAQVVKADDGDLNDTGGVLLKDTNSNGKIDEVHITVDCADITADAVEHTDDNEAETIGKFTVTDTGTTYPVTISSIAFVGDEGATAVFKLVLDETDPDLSADTSGTALDISYDATDSNLKITDGSALIVVATIATDVVEKDGAQPVILTAVDQIGTSLDGGTNIPIDANIIITFSEPMDTETLDANDEWLIVLDPGSWKIPAWSNDDKTLTLEQTVNFSLGEVEAVTLSAPSAISGVTTEDKELQNNSFSFTITDGTNEEEEEDGEITPPIGSLPGPAKPNYHSGVTLYRIPGDPRVYVIKNKKKHWIKTPKEFNAAGYSWGKIKEISAELLEKYPEETLITELLRAIGDHKVYKLEGGKKHWIRTAGEFNAAGYKWENVREVSVETMASYQNAVLSGLLRAVGDCKGCSGSGRLS